MFENGFPKHWSTLKKLIWLVGSGVAGGASAAIKTVSGAIVHITDALAKPAISLVCQINPLQDLHGQDTPYPAGGGVNKLPPMVDGTYTGNGVTAVVKDGIATLSGTTNASGNAMIIPLAEEFTVPSQTCYLHSLNSMVNGYVQPSYELASDPGGTAYAIAFSPANRIIEIDSNNYGHKWDRIRFYLSANVTLSGTYSPMVCFDSVARSYSPYSNECPITGFTGLTVQHSGANVWDEQWENGTFNTKTGANIVNANQIRSKNYIPVKGGLEYYFKAPSGLWVLFFDRDKNAINSGASASFAKSDNSVQLGADSAHAKFTPPTNACFCRFYCQGIYGATYNNDISINYPSTDTSYHAYTGETIPVSWQTEAGTVYGGSLDVTTGVLAPEYAKYSVSEEVNPWTNIQNLTNSNGEAFTTARTITPQQYRVKNYDNSNMDSADGICNVLATSVRSYAYRNQNYPNYGFFSVNGGYISVSIKGTFTTSAEIQAYLESIGCEFCVLLDETRRQQPIQLYPVTVNLLLGENNLWHDANGNTELTYYADGTASTQEALGILLCGAYHNPGGDDDATDDEALGILLGN